MSVFRGPSDYSDLSDTDAWPFLEGAEEIVLRISRYEQDGRTPACYQAVVKGQNRSRVWGVGVYANPVVALREAIAEFRRRDGVGWPDGGENGHKREPVLAHDDEPDVDDLLS